MTIAHGALDYSELAALGLAPASVVDFSSNINPFGPPPEVRAALAALDPAPYPDRSCLALRLALAARHRCDPAQILVGNGSNELIHLIPRALLRAGAAALVVEPTFGEYAHASRLAGALVLACRADLADDLEFDITLLTEILETHRPGLVWICAPNNPLGSNPAPAVVEQLAEACAAIDALLVVDRAYAAFVRDADRQRDPLDGCSWPNLLRLFSLTKSYALAGLRLGYLIAEPALIARVAALQPTWSVSSAAQAAGLAALEASTFLAETMPRLWQQSDSLRSDLTALGLEVLRRELPFMLVQTTSAIWTRKSLLRHAIMVRDCSSFGLPELVRVAPQRAEDNRRLVEVWADLIASGGKA